MPIHDWTRVDESVFRSFVHGWACHLVSELNNGGLPSGYHAGVGYRTFPPRPLVIDEKPREKPTAAFVERVRGRPRRRLPRQITVSIYQGRYDEPVAVVEFVSPANKARRGSVRLFASRIAERLTNDIHVVLLDLLPPTPAAPAGMHAEVWAYFGRPNFTPAADAPLAMVGYNACGMRPRAFIEPTSVGLVVPSVPLFLPGERFVTLPLDGSYTQAFRGEGKYWRDILEAQPGAPA